MRFIMLQALPPEILIMILQKLRERDIFRLAQTSKFFHEMAQPELYRDFVLVSLREKHHDVTNERFLKSFVTPGKPGLEYLGVYKFIRNLTLDAPLHDHPDLPNIYSLQSSNSTARRTLERMEHQHLDGQAANILKHIPDNILQSFNWRIGCVLPAGIFNRSGYLAIHQPQLRSLSVKVQPDYSFSDGLEGLMRLYNLRHLSWQEADYIDSCVFYNVIRRNCHHLETLDLGYQYRSHHMRHVTGLALRSSCLFSPSCSEPEARFEVLRHINLRNMSLHLVFSTLRPNFDFKKIRSLKLRDCRYVLNFLRGARHTNQQINLQALEIDYDAPVPCAREAGGLVLEFVRFLNSFRGLEQLYFRAMDFFVQSIEQTPSAIANHAGTLKRLVCNYHDKLAMGTRKDCTLLWTHHLTYLFNVTRLEAVGMTIVPCELRPAIDGTETSKTIRLLHLRITGQYHSPKNLLHKLRVAGLPKECVPVSLRRPQRRRPACIPILPPEHPFRMDLAEAQRRMKRPINMMELLNFVQWAFSPNGLPNLQVLAYGDFSVKEYFGWSQLVFVRYPRPNMCVPGAQYDPSNTFSASLPFRLMHPEDEYLWDEIDGAHELLEACPVDPEVGYPHHQLSANEMYVQDNYYSDSEMEGGEEMSEEEVWEEFEEDFFH